MKKFLLDTGIAQDLISDRRGVRLRAKTERRKGNRVGICTPVLGELWSGVECSATRDKNLKLLRQGLKRLTVWPFENPAAAEFGRVFAELRKIGRSIQQIDMQIAAIALTMGNCVVVSSDSDLSAVPGLRVENWAA